MDYCHGIDPLGLTTDTNVTGRVWLRPSQSRVRNDFGPDGASPYPIVHFLCSIQNPKSKIQNP